MSNGIAPYIHTLPTLKGPKDRGTPTAKDLRAERKIERIEGIDAIDTIYTIDAIEDRHNRWDGADWWIWRIIGWI